MVISYLNLKLWLKLEEYEKATPTSYIKSLINKSIVTNYSDAMEIFNVTPTDFMDKKIYGNYVKEIIGTNFKGIAINEISQEDETYLYEISTQDRMLQNKVGLKIKLEKNGGNYVATHINIPYTQYSFMAPNDAVILADGKEISKHYKNSELYDVPEFAGLSDKALIPKYVKYDITGIIKIPEISVSTPFDMNDENIVLYLNGKEKTQVEQFAKDFSVTYAKFVSKDAKFADVSKFLVKESECYNSIKGFDNSWYIDHTSPEVLNLETNETIYYSQNAFSTVVSFIYKVKTSITFDKSDGTKGTANYENEYPTKYKVFIVKTSDGYKVANIISI
ncbi:MAG: hypothetical protein RSE93_00425 [Oscillospiraceae bacterium]